MSDNKNTCLSANIVLYNIPKSQIETVMKSVIVASCVKTPYIIDNSPNDKWRILEKERFAHLPERRAA